MASGLAARIKEVFGIGLRLVEGHKGIYEIKINGQVVLTNQGKCGLSATEDEILSAIAKFINPLPGEETMLKTMIPIMRCLS